MDAQQTRGGWTWLGRLTLGCWLGWFANLLLFAAIWRTNSLAPHAAWGILSCVSVCGLTTAAAIVGIVRIVSGPERVRSFGCLLISVSPLLWYSSRLAGLAAHANQRTDRNITTVDRLIVNWAASLGEAEARLPPNRWVRGRSVLLVDDGENVRAEELVAAADDHLQTMADRLGAHVPDVPFYLVRGELLGQRGRAILNFAICGHGEPDSPELTGLDRHELAHTLITVLSGPDHDPPALLVEGWAEANSANVREQIRDLAERKRKGEAYSLRTLISKGWYGAGRSPQYSHGGPLVVYLLEKFGGSAFLGYLTSRTCCC